MRENRAATESDLNRHHVKYEDPLWDEEKENLRKKLIRISVIKGEGPAGKNYDWKFMRDGKVVFVLHGKELVKKEVEFLRTKEGMQKLVSLFKEGNDNASKIKKAIKNENSNDQ